MLILSRKLNEEIRIGEDIILSIIEITKNNVKIGVKAPDNIVILREEVYQNIKQTNLLSSQSFDNFEKAVELWKSKSNNKGIKSA